MTERFQLQRQQFEKSVLVHLTKDIYEKINFIKGHKKNTKKYIMPPKKDWFKELVDSEKTIKTKYQYFNQFTKA